MKNSFLYLFVAVVLITVSCRTTNSVTSKFNIQKRKYTGGWHLQNKGKVNRLVLQKNKKYTEADDVSYNIEQKQKSSIDSVNDEYVNRESKVFLVKSKVVNTKNEKEIISPNAKVGAIESNISEIKPEKEIPQAGNEEKDEKNEEKEHSKFYYFWFSIFLFITNIGYFWALKDPEKAFLKGSRKRKYLRGVFITWIVLSILISLMMGSIFLSSLFVIWPLFSVLFRDKIRKLLGNKKDKKWLWALFTTFFLIISEIGVAIELGRNIGVQLLTFLGFYIGLGVVVLIFYKKDRFNFSQLFMAGGLMGALIEQAFAGPLMLIGGNIAGFLIFAWWVFPVYGFYLATTFLMFYEELTSPQGKEKQKKNGFWKTLLLFISTPAIIFLVGALISKLLSGLGIFLYE